MPKAIVTGATGFMGQHLCRQLSAAGWKVQAIHRRPSSDATLSKLRGLNVATVAIDSSDDLRKFITAAQPDVVFHLAAHQVIDYSASDVNKFLYANVALGTGLLEGLAGSGCVVINAASYFQFRDGEPVAHSLYAATKQAFIEISKFYRCKRGVDVRHVVLYDSFGPADTRNKLIPQLMDAVKTKSSVSLGPAHQAINILYIDDIVAGLIAASGPGNPEFMAVSATESTTVGEIVSEMERVSEATLDKSFDISRETTDLVERSGNWPSPHGWQPEWTLADGLRATFNASN